MSAELNKAIIRRFIEELWNNRNHASIYRREVAEKLEARLNNRGALFVFFLACETCHSLNHTKHLTRDV